MSQEMVVWTVLPNGRKTMAGKKYLRLTVAVSPRCYAGADVLGEYPQFLKWPQSLAGAHFDVVFNGSGGPLTVATVPDPAGQTADPELWGYLFTGATPVNPYTFPDLSQRFVINAPGTAVYNSVKSIYQNTIATFPDTLPNAINPGHTSHPNLFSSLVETYFGAGFPTVAEIHSLLDVLKKKGRTLPPAGGVPASLIQLMLFYQRNWQPVTPFPTTPQTLDFHEQVSSLTKFGELQRSLGLAVDLLVPFSSAIPESGATTVRLRNPVLPGGNLDVCPQTHYTLAGSDFLAKSKSGVTQHGMLDLSNPSAFTLAEIDVDGAGIKLIGLVKHLITGAGFMAETQARTGLPQTIGLPSLRTGGLAILQIGRDAALAQITESAKSANSTAESGDGSSLDFYAEDVTRGFRVDVWDSFTSKWHSLHERGPAIDPKDPSGQVPPKKLPGSYRFTNAPKGSQYFQPTGIDEGFVSPGLTHDPNGPTSGGTDPDLYQHEQLWRWLGWSLSGQRPTGYLDTDDTPTHYGDRGSDDEPGPGVALVTHFGAAAGSLPKLRFGRGYRMRARVVDLAGNSVSPTSTLDTHEVPDKSKPPFTYRRFEPVIPPAVIPHDDLAVYDPNTGQLLGSSPGESTFRLVMRTNYDRTAEEERGFLSGTSPAELGYVHLPRETTRWIAPPQISQVMAEQLGLFDSGSGWRSDALDLMTNYDNSFGTRTLPDGAVIPDAHGGSTLPMPYLSDTLASGATFTGLPGAPIIVYGPKGTLPHGESLAFTGTWPDLEPFRLTLVETDSGKKAPAWDPVGRVLTVFLAKGQGAVVRFSSFLDPAGLNLLGIWGWMEEYRAAGKITATQLLNMEKSALAGLMWALSPFEEITLVNAVQQPLMQPKFLKLASTRVLVGQTDTLLTANAMPIDGLSTVKVDVNASWTDPRDDLELDPCPQPDTLVRHGAHQVVVPGLPKEISSTQHVVEIPVRPEMTSILFDSAANRRHKFGDTKHRFVNYTATATTRFLEYFPNDARIPTTRVSPVAKLNILSTARPKSPNILYAVPAFGWTNSQTGHVTKSDRAGGWLRVYFDRPFYSSGEGELLGVVLINDSTQVDVMRSGRLRRAMSAQGLATHGDDAGVTTALEKYVTQWGMDPLWNSPEISNPPMTSDFPEARTQIGLYLEELGGIAGGVPVGVAGFPVSYDAGRCLFFADLKFHPGNSYYPFVRLALAAFQPNSIVSPDTVHLSRVIMTDFVQVAPDRVAQIQTHVKTGNPKAVKLTVAGVTYAGGFAGRSGTRVEVSVEQPAHELETTSDELAWVPVPHGEYVLTPAKSSGSEETVWTAEFDLPRPAGSTPYRMIVREYELWPQEWGAYVPSATSKDGARKDSVAPPAYDQRLVYAATLQI